MVKINRIYTKTGDLGETGLVDGSRRAKHDLRVAAYGDIDELNSSIGWCLCAFLPSTTESASHSNNLSLIQNELFDLGGELATPPGGAYPPAALINEGHIKRLEQWIDLCVNEVPELRSFILPGGSELAARLHIARTICRRAERSVTALHEREPLRAEVLQYVNRLSDLLFAMARVKNQDAGVSEPLWVPGASRTPAP